MIRDRFPLVLAGLVCRISRVNTAPGEPNASETFSGIESGLDVLRSELEAPTTSWLSAESVLCLDNLGIASTPPEGEVTY